MAHVIDYQTIPEDIRAIFETARSHGAEEIRASSDGHWLLELRGGANAVAIEGAIRAANLPAFGGAPSKITLRAITAAEADLFSDDDADILRTVIGEASQRDELSVIDRIGDALQEDHHGQH